MKNLIAIIFVGIILSAFISPKKHKKSIPFFIPDCRVDEMKFFHDHYGLPYKITASVFYIDATLGDDSKDGLSPSNAWKTIGKTNTIITIGNTFLFKRGEIFYGSVIPKGDGNIYDSYGSGGDKPVITGFTTVGSWVTLPGGIYQSTVIADSTLHMVTVNNVAQTIAVGANPDSANNGWKTYRSVVKGGQLAHDTIRGMPSGMLGKFFYIRQNDWSILFVRCIKQMVDTVIFKYAYTLNIGGNSPIDISKDLFGWKPFNDEAYLDRHGEYVYRGTTLKIKLDLAPANYTIKVSTVDTLFNNAAHKNTIIRNLNFTGGNQFGIYGNTADNILIDNCNFDNMGAEGIAFYRLSNSTISNNYISNCLATGIYVQSVTSPYSNINILNNYLTRIGKLQGMGSEGLFGDYSAMNVIAFSGLNIKYNVIFDIGDCGIKWNGSQVEIAYNSVTLFCQLLQDHAGYYNFWDNGTCPGVTIPGNCAFFRNRWVHNNFASYAIGNIDGTPPNAARKGNLFYSDGINGYTLYEYNYGDNFSRSFMVWNIDSNMIARYNIGMPNDSSIFLNAIGLIINQQGNSIIRNSLVSNNTWIIDAVTQNTFSYFASVSQVNIAANLSAIGIIDSNNVNYFQSSVFKVGFLNSSGAATSLLYTQAGLLTLAGIGIHDRLLPSTPKSDRMFVKNYSNAIDTVSLDGIYIDPYNTLYNGRIILQPYTAAYIFKKDTVIIPAIPGKIRLRLRVVN